MLVWNDNWQNYISTCLWVMYSVNVMHCNSLMRKSGCKETKVLLDMSVGNTLSLSVILSCLCVCSWCSWPTYSSWCGWEWQRSPACRSSCSSTSGPCVRTPAWWMEPTSAWTCVSLVWAMLTCCIAAGWMHVAYLCDGLKVIAAEGLHLQYSVLDS